MEGKERLLQKDHILQWMPFFFFSFLCFDLGDGGANKSNQIFSRLESHIIRVVVIYVQRARLGFQTGENHNSQERLDLGKKNIHLVMSTQTYLPFRTEPKSLNAGTPTRVVNIKESKYEI